jgi:hypothetical protein
MTDLIESFCESAVERLRPLATLPRLLYLIALLVIASDGRDTVLSLAILSMSVSDAATVVHEALTSVAIWEAGIILFAVFIAIPFTSSWLTSLLARKRFAPSSGALVERLDAVRWLPRHEALRMKEDQLHALQKRKALALKRMERRKIIAEFTLYIVLTMLLSITVNSLPLAVSFSVLVLAVGGFWLASRSMFLSFLKDIKPYDVWVQRLTSLQHEQMREPATDGHA